MVQGERNDKRQWESTDNHRTGCTLVFNSQTFTNVASMSSSNIHLRIFVFLHWSLLSNVWPSSTISLTDSLHSDCAVETVPLLLNRHMTTTLGYQIRRYYWREYDRLHNAVGHGKEFEIRAIDSSFHMVLSVETTVSILNSRKEWVEKCDEVYRGKRGGKVSNFINKNKNNNTDHVPPCRSTWSMRSIWRNRIPLKYSKNYYPFSCFCRVCSIHTSVS